MICGNDAIYGSNWFQFLPSILNQPLHRMNSKLDPKMSESEVFELVKTSLDCYIPLPPGGVKKGKDETYEDHLESESFMKITQDALQDVMCQIILKDPTPDGLDSVFKVRLYFDLSPLLPVFRSSDFNVITRNSIFAAFVSVDSIRGRI